MKIIALLHTSAFLALKYLKNIFIKIPLHLLSLVRLQTEATGPSKQRGTIRRQRIYHKMSLNWVLEHKQTFILLCLKKLEE